jgi:hypothetical protein
MIRQHSLWKHVIDGSSRTFLNVISNFNLNLKVAEEAVMVEEEAATKVVEAEVSIASLPSID